MGIIGGADGPTYIFTISTLDLVLTIVGIVVFVGGIRAAIVWRKKQRHQ